MPHESKRGEYINFLRNPDKNVYFTKDDCQPGWYYIKIVPYWKFTVNELTFS